MITRGGSAITWYSYNLPKKINNGSSSAEFFYNAGRGRFKQIAITAAGGALPAGTETTIYIGGIYERVTKASGDVEYKHAIIAGGEAVAIRTLRSTGANDTRYLHKDHLGSLDVLSSETGAVVQRLSTTRSVSVAMMPPGQALWLQPTGRPSRRSPIAASPSTRSSTTSIWCT